MREVAGDDAEPLTKPQYSDITLYDRWVAKQTIIKCSSLTSFAGRDPLQSSRHDWATFWEGTGGQGVKKGTYKTQLCSSEPNARGYEALASLLCTIWSKLPEGELAKKKHGGEGLDKGFKTIMLIHNADNTTIGCRTQTGLGFCGWQPNEVRAEIKCVAPGGDLVVSFAIICWGTRHTGHKEARRAVQEAPVHHSNQAKSNDANQGEGRVGIIMLCTTQVTPRWLGFGDSGDLLLLYLQGCASCRMGGPSQGSSGQANLSSPGMRDRWRVSILFAL